MQLIVSSSAVCSDTIVQEVFINPSPNIRFVAPGVCYLDSTSCFDSSTVALGNILEWDWDFGDGRTTSGFNPLHEYLAPGTYNVQLTTTSDSGCIQVNSRSINVYEPATFTQLQLDTVCFGYPSAVLL